MISWICVTENCTVIKKCIILTNPIEHNVIQGRTQIDSRSRSIWRIQFLLKCVSYIIHRSDLTG